MIYEGTKSSTPFFLGCHLVISMLNILTSLVTGFDYFLIITLSVFSGLAG